MKPLYLTILALLFLSTLTPAFAIEQPRIVPRMNQVPKPIDEVYARLKKYFSDPLNHFQLVSADPKKHTIVAKQSGIDSASWNNWAFCKTGPVEMIYKYEDGTVTVTEGHPDIGGSRASMAMMVAEVLGVPFESVHTS